MNKTSTFQIYPTIAPKSSNFKSIFNRAQWEMCLFSDQFLHLDSMDAQHKTIKFIFGSSLVYWG